MENKDELVLSEYDIDRLYFDTDCFIKADESNIDEITFGELFDRYREAYQYKVGKCYAQMRKDSIRNNYDVIFIKVKDIVDDKGYGEYIEVTPYNLHYLPV